MSLKDKIKFKKEKDGYYMYIGKDFSISLNNEVVDFIKKELSEPPIKFERKHD